MSAGHDEEDPPPPGPARDARIGMLLAGRYRIEKKLGEGGMGAVYQAEHVMIGKRVAIKTLHAHLATDANVVTRFHREARAATAIGNEHIVEVTDFGSFPDGAAFMVLEYLEGVELADLVEREGPLPLGRAVHVLAQVCDALGAAHEKGIVHRDLKPENVFLIRRGDDPDFVKVLDFGISKITGDESAGKLTSTGAAMGTPYYMSPEQARGAGGVDARTDIYAMGVMFFNLLTARYPFEGSSLPMLVVQICHDPPPPLRELRPDAPAPIEAVIAKMLAKDPDERFASCREVKAAILPFRSVDSAPVVRASREPAADAFAETSTAAEGVATGPLRRADALAETMAAAGATPTPEQAPTGRSRRPLLWVAGGLAVASATALAIATAASPPAPAPSDASPAPAEVEVEAPSPPEPAPEAPVAETAPIVVDAGTPAPAVAIGRPRPRPPVREVAREPVAAVPEPPPEPPPAVEATPAETPARSASDELLPELVPTKRPRLFGGGAR